MTKTGYGQTKRRAEYDSYYSSQSETTNRKPVAGWVGPSTSHKSKKAKVEVIEVLSDSESKHEEYSDEDPYGTVFEIPASIDAILRFMDEREPGQNYHERQADSRGGCSGTRGKLRKFANKNPNHPGVAHWVETKDWQPPSKASLVALIDLIKTFIK